MKKIVLISSSTEPRFTIKWTYDSDGVNQYYKFHQLTTKEVDNWINVKVIDNFDTLSTEEQDSIRIKLLTILVDRENKDLYNTERRNHIHTVDEMITNTKSRDSDGGSISLFDIYVDEDQEDPEDYTMRKANEEIAKLMLNELIANTTPLQYERFIKRNYDGMTLQEIADSEGLKGSNARKTIQESLDSVERKLVEIRKKYNF